MSDKVTVVRPDGSTLNVTREEAEQLRSIGYQNETPLQGHEEAVATATEDYYTTPGQQIKTVGEGLASGLSIGLTDIATEGLGWDSGDRAAYNPGLRLGSEIVGGLAPAFVTGGESLAAKALLSTPAGLLARGAEAVATVGAGRVAQGVVRGAVEGAGLGLGAQVTNAQLNGDPLTVESVIAGMGWGAVWGGGLGGVASKLGNVAEEYAAKRAAAMAAEKGEVIAAEKWGAFRSSVDDARRVSKEAVDSASAKVHAAKLPPSKEEVTEAVFKATNSIEEGTTRFVNEVTHAGKLPAVGVRAAKEDVMKSLRRTMVAATDGNTAKFEALLAEHAEKVNTLAKLSGMAAPEMEQLVLRSGAVAEGALEEIKALRDVDTALSRFPATAEGFAATSPAKMERHIQAVDGLMKTGGAEMEGVRQAVKQTISDMAASSGLKLDGNPAEQLRGIYEAARASRKGAKGSSRIGNAVGYIAGSYGAQTMAAAGPAGRAAGYAAGQLVSGLLGLKGAVVGTLQNSIGKWAPKAVRAAEKVKLPARVDPLRTRLDGTVDESKRSRKQLMADRAAEIRAAAPTMRDTLYRSLSKIAGAHPEFAATAHEMAAKQFEALTARLPRDPGTAFARMKSLWVPDDIATEKFARIYEVFQNPVAVTKKALETGQITTEAATALREFNPELFQVLRLGMLERLAEPGNLEKMSYQEQIMLGQLLDLTIHSTASPRFIAAQQAMYRERSQPKQPITPTASNSNNPSGGRPGGSTAAQRITDH